MIHKYIKYSFLLCIACNHAQQTITDEWHQSTTKETSEVTNHTLTITKIELSIDSPSICQNDMLFIKGEYCPNSIQTCIKWLDDPKFTYARCAEYAPSKCKNNKIHKEFCIDTDEVHESNGSVLGDMSWQQCSQICNDRTKRLCEEDEWTFSCMGEEMQPYPYGYSFNHTICNIEREPLLCNGKVCDHREPISAFKQCVSPFGVHNMIGNVDEWISVPRYNHSKIPGATMRSALKGGHFAGGRHRCSVKTTDHDETFHQISTGCRCCSDKK